MIMMIIVIIILTIIIIIILFHRIYCVFTDILNTKIWLYLSYPFAIGYTSSQYSYILFKGRWKIKVNELCLQYQYFQVGFGFHGILLPHNLQIKTYLFKKPFSSYMIKPLKLDFFDFLSYIFCFIYIYIYIYIYVYFLIISYLYKHDSRNERHS